MPPSMPKRQSSKASELSLTKSRHSRLDMGSDLDFARGKTLLKPDDQLPLGEAELSEEIAKVLTTANPRIPDNLVQWSYKEKQFVKLPPPPNIVTIFNVAGTVLHKDSEEARKQVAGGGLATDEDDEDAEENAAEGDEEADEGIEEDEAGDEDSEEPSKAADATAEADEGEEEEAERAKPKKIPNQFNFCERAALTYQIPTRDMTTQTTPPPTASFADTIFQWTMFDEYQADYEQQQREKEKDRKQLGQQQQQQQQQQRKDELKRRAQAENTAMTNRMLQSVKTLERMVNQNIFDDISQDYRYWDDPSDEFKDGEGSLLPLWKFSYERTKKHDVADLCFNSRYYDLFAVACGSMTFDNPMPSGYVCLFSVKNPSYPEWIFTSESPVMCLDFNTRNPYLLVIGTMDGTVAVYNVMLPSSSPQYKSNDVTQKHAGIVWQVCWAPDTEEGNLAFYSVSVDGKINHWVLNQNELGVTTIMTLFLDQPPIPGPDGTMITLKGCGTCIAFHPSDPNVFLVGTEEGTIYKCNTAYSSVYMRTYGEAHNMPVYRIVFNKFNSSIFASCSGDWRVKIWEDDRPEPLFMFDLGVPIGDVQWAPYSSTVIACVSNDGKVTVFDLNVNKYRPICSQSVVSKKRGKLTRLAFNHSLPFVIVGDDKGTVSTLKLSPNLRTKVKPTKKQLHLSNTDLETMKLEKLLSFVREPPVLVPPKDIKPNTL